MNWTEVGAVMKGLMELAFWTVWFCVAICVVQDLGRIAKELIFIRYELRRIADAQDRRG